VKKCQVILDHALPRKLFGSLSFEGMTLEQFVRALVREFIDHEILTRSAAIAFYAMLACVPFIAVLLALSVQLLPDFSMLPHGLRGVEQQAVHELEHGMKTLIPENAYDLLDVQILRMQHGSPKAILSVSLAVSLWVASSLFMAVMDALNHIYGVNETRNYWHRRIISMGMTVIQSILLMGSLATIIAWPQILTLVGLGPVAAIAASVAHFFGAFIITLFIFALAFQIGPHSPQREAWITPGSILGSTFFLSITYLFRVYVQHFGSYDKVYGSLGGVMVLLLWFWLSAAVLLGAAAINKVLDHANRAKSLDS
jgi:membrane protein